MITGAHVVLYSKDADADRAFIRDVLGFPHLDVGGGWLIFAMPPAEVAVHPAKKNGAHELFLMCDDVKKLVADMKKRKIACSPISNEGWGLLTQVTLPSGNQLGVYQPRHPSPKWKKPSAARAKSAR